MRNLVFITMLVVISQLTMLYADDNGGKKFYSYPNANTMNDTDRVMIYQTLSGTRNITGNVLRRQILRENSKNAAQFYNMSGTAAVMCISRTGAVYIGRNCDKR